MRIRRVVLAGLITTGVVGLLVAPTVAAGGGASDDKSFGYRPGWGGGGTNHEHTGPPGLADKDNHGKGPKADKDDHGKGPKADKDDHGKGPKADKD